MTTFATYVLRILARYEAQNRPLIYISFDISINTLSFKNLDVLFGRRVHRCKKCTNIWKVPSSGRAEIENVKITSGSIFNFSSATRGHFSNVSAIYRRFVKKSMFRFFIRCLLRKLGSYLASILKGYSILILFMSDIRRLILNMMKYLSKNS